MVLHKFTTVIKKLSAYFFLSLTLGLADNLTWAQENQNAFIMHHIRDAHEWHFATINHKHLTLALPIILISKDRGVEIFLSSRFVNKHHHYVAYKDYILNTQDQVISSESGRTFYDFSITKNLVYMFINVAVLLAFTLLGARWYQRHTYRAPKGLWSFLELMIVFIQDDIAIPNIGTKHYRRFMPYLLSIFFFIWLNNLTGLLPSAANVTGNISITFV
jgi:F-type H+-transporting ATPase subunit a